MPFQPHALKDENRPEHEASWYSWYHNHIPLWKIPLYRGSARSLVICQATLQYILKDLGDCVLRSGAYVLVFVESGCDASSGVYYTPGMTSHHEVQSFPQGRHVTRDYFKISSHISWRLGIAQQITDSTSRTKPLGRDVLAWTSSSRRGIQVKNLGRDWRYRKYWYREASMFLGVNNMPLAPGNVYGKTGDVEHERR